MAKSVSRFARNTVDSLINIRKLKENGVEVYFEKENIYSMDGKGELTQLFNAAGCTKLHFDGVEGHLFMVAGV